MGVAFGSGSRSAPQTELPVVSTWLVRSFSLFAVATLFVETGYSLLFGFEGATGACGAVLWPIAHFHFREGWKMDDDFWDEESEICNCVSDRRSSLRTLDQINGGAPPKMLLGTCSGFGNARSRWNCQRHGPSLTFSRK